MHGQGKAPVARATAKDELVRINSLLGDDTLLIIGGLAVQQYHEARNSADLDLVCDHETARRLLSTLYPSIDWKVENTQSEIRPSFDIEHKVNGMKVFFGPKIIERGEYANLSWLQLSVESKPFRYQGDIYLHKIRVPSAHNLAYSKLISFIGRSEKEQKALADLEDFVNLSNHETFAISTLYDLIRRNMAEDRILAEFVRIIDGNDIYKNKIKDSCLNYFANLFRLDTTTVAQHTHAHRELPKKTVYLGAPHKNTGRNTSVAETLRHCGIGVKVPFDEVKLQCGTATPSEPNLVRQICMDAIIASDGVVIDVDHYGLDTAWEVGFAEGLNKFVIGYNEDVTTRNTPRMINRRPYNDNFMHGWSDANVFKDITHLTPYIAGKTVYICGSFDNKEIEKAKNEISSHTKKTIFPKDFVEPKAMPRDYPLQRRINAINQLDESDVILVVLPRYGMDASWQIGYATAKKKVILGLLLEDDKKAGDHKTFWDHWMHGWNEKDIFSGQARLCAALSGYIRAGIV